MSTGSFVIAQDVVMPSPVIDEIPTHPHHHHHHLPNPNPVVNVLLAGCAYEIVATGVNTWLDEPTLPLLSNGIKSFTWKALGGRLLPAWALPAGLVAVGFVVAVAVTGPRQRRRIQKSARSRAVPAPETSRS
jgi:hypothetical protein